MSIPWMPPDALARLESAEARLDALKGLVDRVALLEGECARLQSALTRAAEEIVTLQDALQHASTGWNEALARAEAGEAREKRLREALAFYADEGNYSNTGYEQRQGTPCPVEGDQGKRARTALEGQR